MTADLEKLERRARNILLHQLSRSMRTEQQLREVMIKREIPSEVFEPILVRFRESQLIDDQSFAGAYLSSRLAAGKSVNAIRRELARKGVAASIIDFVCADVSLAEELERATALAKKRFQKLAGLEPAVARRRLQGYLARRGFASSVVISALREVERAG